jgi:hypothetical protein
VTNSALVAGSFTVHQPGFFEVDTVQTLTLVNSSGADLENCVISARVSDAAGKSYLNLHFTPHWPKGERLTARYTSSDFPMNMLENVVRVDVTVWSSNCSFEPMTIKMPAAGWLDAK